MKAILKILYLSMMLPSCCICDYPYDIPTEHIRFKCSIDNEHTKSYTYMESGVVALIYTFNENSIYYPVGEGSITAISTGYGDLSTNSMLSLPDGVYDFYSFSCNLPVMPSVSNYLGYIYGLDNGQDYLWATARQMNLANGREIYLNYRHIACKIQLSVNAGNNVTSISINDIRCTYPSTSGVALDLSQGTITPSSFVESPSSIPGTGNSRTFILLPCSSPLNIVVLMDANIDGEYKSGRSFQSMLDFNLEGGIFYDITLTLNSDNTYTTTCYKKEWEILSETITY